MFKYIKNKIHILQNIYIKNNYLINKDSYAMDGEDLAIEKYSKNMIKGFYVDIGAHHPVQRSNTCLLYKKGWRGINVDLSKFSLDLFNYLRPEDINIQCAISDIDGEIELFYQKEFSQLNTTDIKWAKENFNNNFKTQRIKCKTFNSLLSETKYKNHKIDFLNVDVEGAEMKILSGLNFNIYDPSQICIEILGYRHLDTLEKKEQALKSDPIYKFLTEKKYIKVWSGSSYCSHLFVKNI